MRPKITIWTQEGCGRCATVAGWFRANGYEVETRSAEFNDLAAEPEELRRTVLSDLQIQDGAFPLVYIGNRVVHPDDVDSIIDSAKASSK